LAHTSRHNSGFLEVSSVNENSLVVRLDLGTRRVLLMGDAEAGGRKNPSNPASAGSIEKALLDCCASDIAADVRM
jgi:competence protein ComEC